MRTLEASFGNLLLTDNYISTNAPLKDAANLKQTIFEYEPRAATYKQFQNLSSYTYRLLKEQNDG